MTIQTEENNQGSPALTLQDRILDQAPKERTWLFTENGDAINEICFQPQNTTYIFSNCVIP